MMRTLINTLAEREPRRPRADLGVDLLKLTKLTLSDDIEVFMTTFERSMEAHKIARGKWPMLLAPQLTGKAQQAYAALSSEDSKEFIKVKEAIFKRYDINEETYRQRFRTAKVKEGESLSEVVTRLKDMAAKWLKEHDTREKVIDVLVLEQFVTMLPEEVRVWVKEHKPESSVIVGRLAEDYQQARKTAEEDPIRIKEKYPEGGKRCLICHRIGHIAKDCPNKSYRTNMRTPEGNISTGTSKNSVCS